MRPMKCESLMNKDGSLSLDKIQFPKLVSPKLDGNRCYIEHGQAKSSSGKPIRNNYIRKYLSQPEFSGYDGELVVGSPTAKDVRRKTHSGVSKTLEEPDFIFYVFDDFTAPGGFHRRLERVRERERTSRISILKHQWVRDLDSLLALEESYLSLGYEGVVLRCPEAPYKQGRSTLAENWALKIKRFEDGEAVILDCYERMHNDNPQTRNDHGKAERSSHKANLRPAGDLGGFVVKDLKTGVEFQVGTGFEANDRRILWSKRDLLPGSIITYKHFPVGAKDKPNLPCFVSFRDLEDL